MYLSKNKRMVLVKIGVEASLAYVKLIARSAFVALTTDWSRFARFTYETVV
jgi:hypothetical protein